ncbi:coenzyme F420-0:L-glutamate ligase [Humibacter ginsenosidimutans]|uniref:Coenzyme F420-0:L-glutamate ligase n=1 Tax=Humibacter ginsenosidimutans TaxID=2599293 RepID=A0A5B8M367_9MICO|nr:coenzyme F420-0:L-glutamate ligase [Humibacter ginsenosidimutans]
MSGAPSMREPEHSEHAESPSTRFARSGSADASTSPEAPPSAEAPTTGAITAWPVPGIPEIAPGDDLAAIVAGALEADAAAHPERALRSGDILIVTSKIVSKAEGRVVAADDREQAITDETVRVVATRAYDGGVTRIVENRQGVVGAAAGVDASNVADGSVLLLPRDPDASARALLAAWNARFGIELGVIISDTLGRTWRIGQTDLAIGAAGVRVVDDLRGQTDAAGRALAVTQPAVGDELAALGDLVKGKASGCPVAVVRGTARLLEPQRSAPFTAGRSLTRTGQGDMFRLGTDEALAEGYRSGLAAGLALATGARPRWTVVVPFKGGDGAKSRFAGEAGLDRRRLSSAFLLDTLDAIRTAVAVDAVIVVSSEPSLAETVHSRADAIVPDPSAGLNAAVAAGVLAAHRLHPGSFVAVLVGDLPALRGEDLDAALRSAVDAARHGHPYSFVPDADGTGTTAITAAPGATISSRFGRGSAALHRDAGFVELVVATGSSLRQDVDDPRTLEAFRGSFGSATEDLLAARPSFAR